jgi:hypothetical protein
METNLNLTNTLEDRINDEIQQYVLSTLADENVTVLKRNLNFTQEDNKRINLPISEAPHFIIFSNRYKVLELCRTK